MTTPATPAPASGATTVAVAVVPKYTPEETREAQNKLNAALVDAQQKAEFAAFRPLAAVMDAKIDPLTPTACVAPNLKMRFGVGFLNRLDRKEVLFLYFHEIMHVFLRHLWRDRALWLEDTATANKAMDYVVNAILKETDPDERHIVMPKGGCYDPRFKDMAWPQVYYILREEQQSGKGGKGGGGQPLDDHEMSDGSSPQDGEPDQQTIERIVDAAIRQGAALQRMMGRGGGALDRALDEATAHKVSLVEQLMQFCTETLAGGDDSTWRRLNRRFIGQNLIMPSHESHAMREAVVAFDTSGSIGQDELALAFSCLKTVFESLGIQRMHVVYWDDGVAGHEQYDSPSYADLTSRTKPKGGGGTAYSPVTQFLRDKRITPDVAVIFTDGYVADWGDDPGYPTISVVHGSQNETPFGRTLFTA